MIAEPISSDPIRLDLDNVDTFEVGDELQEEKSKARENEDPKQAKKADLIDRTNLDYRNDQDSDDKRFPRTKLTLGELRGKSFKKMHEENMKRRMVQP